MKRLDSIGVRASSFMSNTHAAAALFSLVAFTCLGSQTALAALADDFVTTWKTDNLGTSDDTSITVPMVGGPYDVDWDNDGTFDQFGLSGSVTHDYEVIGTYTIRIRGTYDSIRFNWEGDKDKILSLDQWGTNAWTTMNAAFKGAGNLQVLAIDIPDFSSVTDMSAMFAFATSANPDTSSWDTSAVTNMAEIFSKNPSVDPDTSSWDTSAVTDMSFMFYYASSANPDTSGWDTSAVTNMDGIFRQAISASPDTSNWDTTAVTNMRQAFSNAVSANPDVSGWDTSAVTDMYGLFQDNPSANPDVGGWDTSAVTKTMWMFENATSFDQDIGSWDVTALLYASGMFAGAGLSTANYESLLIGWDAQALQPDVSFNGGNSTYCSEAAISARANMIASDSWVITDGGLCSPDDVNITAFMVSPNAVLTGEATQVSWQVTNAESCTAQGGPPEWLGANITLPAGSLDLAVGEQGCYTLGLECLSGSNTVSETINLEVKHPDVIFMDNFEEPCLLP